VLANAADSARPGLGRRLATALYKRPRLQLGLLLAPPVGALVIAYLGALLLLLINAFWRYDAFTGSVVAQPTLDNFAQIPSTTVFRDVAVRTILTAAAATQTASKGAFLLFIYSLGFGIPFLGFALVYSRAGTFRVLRRHGQAIERAGGAMLVGIGVLLVTGGWARFFTPLVRLLVRKGWPPI